MTNLDRLDFQGVRFRPWIGEAFHSPSNRLLVLGESHYGESSDDYPELTRDVVSGYLTNTSGKFFTNIAQVVSGKHWSDEGIDIRAIWQSIAFYNYVQTLMRRSRQDPTEAEWETRVVPFKTIVHELKPAQVLVLGNRPLGPRWRPPGRTD